MKTFHPSRKTPGIAYVPIGAEELLRKSLKDELLSFLTLSCANGRCQWIGPADYSGPLRSWLK